MDSFLTPTLSSDGMMPSGGAAPFDDIFPEKSPQREPKKLSDLAGSRYQENKENSLKNHSYRRVKSRYVGSAMGIFSGIIALAAGAVAAWTAGVVFGIFAAGLICSGAGRVIYAGASLGGLVINARRKGSLRNEWKTFFHCIAQAILREVPKDGLRIRGKLRDVGLQNHKYQRIIEMCTLIGSVLSFGGGVTAAVAAGMTGGTAFPVTAFAMIMFGAGGVASAGPFLAHLNLKGSLADGVSEMCNFAEMERLHGLTCPDRAIGKNVIRLHKYYKTVKRVRLFGSVLGVVGGVMTVAAGAVEISNGDVTAYIFGAGVTVFGSAGVLMHAASFVAWILLRRIKESFQRDWRECFHRIEMARLRELGKNSKKVCEKLRAVANKLDRHHQNVQTAKAAGSGISLLGGIAAAAGAVAVVMTGGAAVPLVATGAGLVACGVGKGVNKGADFVETVININELEALQDEWNGFYTLFSQELEALHKKSAMYAAELEQSIAKIFTDVGSTLLNFQESIKNNGKQATDAQKTDSAAKDGKRPNQKMNADARAELEKKILPYAKQISVDFVDLVNTAVQLDAKRKSAVTVFLLKLADDLEKVANRLCTDDEDITSGTK